MTLISRFMTNTYVVTRRGPGTYVHGIYEPGTEETIEVLGSLQPLSPRELKLPEEGTRLKQYFKFYTDQPILPVNTKTLAGSDLVTVDGETFKVMSVESWAGTTFPYFLSILSRESTQ